jgi:hypothetical protein
MTIRISAAAVMLALATSAGAQGNLSTQGLGFPPGQLSTAARTMGGATGEADPFSPLNPGALGLLSGAIIAMQAEPEYRTVVIGPTSQRTSVARFPLFQGALSIGSRWAVGVATSTLLDRTWQTTTRDTQVIGGSPLPATVSEQSDGSIADTRVAVSYAITPWLEVGIGGHAISGRDQLHTIRAFDDTDRFATDTQATILSFGGNAVSIGTIVKVGRAAVIGASYRAGGGVSSETATETVGTGSVPDRMGVSFVYTGINETTLALRVSQDQWSSLRGLANNLQIHEGIDVGAGVEMSGPSFGSNQVGLRLGGRWRTLPFSPNATPVKEQTYGGGFALPMARSRIELNVGALYALRTNSAIGGAKEKAWTISTGFSVRP